MDKYKYSGFSMAEALITLLIVCLIVVASVPILTKKKIKMKVFASGSWICTLNSSGQHVVYSSQTKEWRVTGSECTFIPPAKTRNFEVVAVGGGGGGASGYSSSGSNRIIGYKNSTNYKYFTAPYTGDYEFIVIGGGGAGGERRKSTGPCRNRVAGSGGSGGFQKTTLRLYEGNRYYLYAGRGGVVTSRNGNSGEDSYVKNLSNSSYLIKATGGNGGVGFSPLLSCRASCRDDINHACRGVGGSPNGVQGYYTTFDGEDYSVPGALCRTSVASLSGISVGGINCNELLTSSKYLNQSDSLLLRSPDENKRYALPYGYGGNGRDTSANCTDGGPGLVLLNYGSVSAGGGGKAAEAYRPVAFPQIKKLVARVGAGGKGATISNSNGTSGGRTEFVVETQDREINGSAYGASGGYSDYSRSSSSNYIAGENGETSEVKPIKSKAKGGFGGFADGNLDNVNGQRPPLQNENYYGAGGGGGGANSSRWGVGGDGAPGAVIIYW